MNNFLPHTFYNDTYNGNNSDNVVISFPEGTLHATLKQLGYLKVICNNKITNFSDIWKLKAYEGSNLPEYYNKEKISDDFILLDFTKIHIVSELYNNGIGIRFFISLATDKVIVDIVKYHGNKRTSLKKRFSGSVLESISLQTITEYLSYIQGTESDIDPISLIIQH